MKETNRRQYWETFKKTWENSLKEHKYLQDQLNKISHSMEDRL